MTEQAQQPNRLQKRGGKMVVTAVTMTMTTMKPRSDHCCGDGEWRAAATATATAVAVASGDDRMLA